MTTNDNLPALPRGGAAGRALSNIHADGNKTPRPELEADFAVAFVAKRYRVTQAVARTIVVLANLGALL